MEPPVDGMNAGTERTLFKGSGRSRKVMARVAFPRSSQRTDFHRKLAACSCPGRNQNQSFPKVANLTKRFIGFGWHNIGQEGAQAVPGSDGSLDPLLEQDLAGQAGLS